MEWNWRIVAGTRRHVLEDDILGYGEKVAAVQMAEKSEGVATLENGFCRSEAYVERLGCAFQRKRETDSGLSSWPRPRELIASLHLAA